jgi:hypothetical protein
LGPLETVAVLDLCVVFREAHNTFILQVWCHLIDIHSTLLHVKFEDGSSIPILKTKATRHKNLQLEIEKFPKKKNQSPACPFNFSARLFQNPKMRM